MNARACLTRALALLALALTPVSGQEEERAPPPVRIECAVATKGTPYVGQRVVVVVTLYTRTSFETAPAFDLPPVRGGILLPPEDRPVVGSTTVDDETYTTGRHELSYFAQRPGKHTLPPFKVRFASPPEWGEPAVERALMTPRLEVEAVMPPGAEGLTSIICATGLHAEQSLQPTAKTVQVGAALTRTVTLRATGVPGMALPPALGGEVAGASSYPAPPKVRDDRARGAFASARTDRVTYVFERSGEARFPALVIRWWNLTEKRLETIRLPGVRVTVEAAPAPAQPDLPPPRRERTWWPFVLLALIGGGVMLRGSGWNRARRRRRAASESGQFAAVRAACRGGDPKAALAAIYRWLAVLRPEGEVATLASLAPTVPIELQQRLLAAAAGAGAWGDGATLLAALGQARGAALKKAALNQRVLEPLNP